MAQKAKKTNVATTVTKTGTEMKNSGKALADVDAINPKPANTEDSEVDDFDEDDKSFSPMDHEYAASMWGPNAARYLQPADLRVPCEDEYYFWAERASGALYSSMSYEHACEFAAQAVRMRVENNPQGFIAELIHLMKRQRPFSMTEFCMTIARDTIAELLFIPGKKLAEAKGER